MADSISKPEKQRRDSVRRPISSPSATFQCYARAICAARTSDDSIYRYIVFDIDISYRMVSSKKISTFSVYRDILIYLAIF